MSTIKTSVTDAMNIMRDRATTAQTSLDNARKRRMSIRNKQIATAAGYVVGVAAGVVAAAVIVQKTSKVQFVEDED